MKCRNLIPYPDLTLFKAWPREIWVQDYLDPKLTWATKHAPWNRKAVYSLSVTRDERTSKIKKQDEIKKVNHSTFRVVEKAFTITTDLQS